MPMDSISMCSNTLYMSNMEMERGSSFRWLSASTMIQWHQFDSPRIRQQDLSGLWGYLDVSELRLTLRSSLLRSAVDQGTRIVTLQEPSKAVVVAYIERTIRGTNPRPTFDVWAHNLSSEATQGKASAVADKRLPNHWAKDFWLRV